MSVRTAVDDVHADRSKLKPNHRTIAGRTKDQCSSKWDGPDTDFAGYLVINRDIRPDQLDFLYLLKRITLTFLFSSVLQFQSAGTFYYIR